MHTVVDYVPNTATGKILTGGDIDMIATYNIPGGINPIDCVLTLMVSTANATNLHVQAKLNDGSVIFDYGPTSTSITRPFQQIFSGLVPGKEGGNKITFRIIGGTGSFAISNSVIWYRKNIP